VPQLLTLLSIAPQACKLSKQTCNHGMVQCCRNHTVHTLTLLKPGTSCVEARRASASVSNLLSSASQLEMECTVVPRCCSDEIRPRCSFSFPKKLSHRCVDAIPKVSLPLRYQKAHRFSSKRMCCM